MATKMSAILARADNSPMSILTMAKSFGVDMQLFVLIEDPTRNEQVAPFM